MAPGAIPVPFLRLARVEFIGVAVGLGLGWRLILARAFSVRDKRSNWR